MNWEICDKPLVIAHRGFSLHHVENTLEAVEAAIRLGCDGVEVDLRMTADQEIVVFHDRSLKRLADQEGDVEELTLSRIRQVRLKGSAVLPTLEELLDLVGDRTLLNLELKTVRLSTSRIERHLLQTLKRFRLGPTVLISSFHPLPLWRLKGLAPEIRRGTLASPRFLRTRYRQALDRWINPFSLHADQAMIRPQLIEQVHQAGKKIFAWTVNEEGAMKRLIGWGVDGIFSDRPDLLLKVRSLP